MPDYSSTSARAERGALLLDVALPGWALHLRLTLLDMTSETRCVLGQLMQYDPRVRAQLRTMLHEEVATSCRTYRGAALVVFKGWPVAQRLYDHGFTGSVWAQVRTKPVDLLAGAWFLEAERRGGGRVGQSVITPKEVDAPLEP